MKKIVLFLVVILAFVILARFNNDNDMKSTNQPTRVPDAGEQELIAWFASWDSQKAEESLPPVIDKFSIYSPMLYRVMEDSTLGRHEISNRDEIIVIGRDHNKPIAPVITDEGNLERIQTLLDDSEKQKAFFADLVQEAKDENFSGWSIDIEKLTSGDKDAFSNFVKNLSEELHNNDLKLYMIAYGRDADETYDPAKAHDYKVLGQYADQVQLMIYYYNNEFTDPGGQTPNDWYRSVLTYALETIPREKIVVGLSTHGNDWGGEEVEGLTYQDVARRLEETNAVVSYDEKEISMVARYDKDGTEHTLYYETAKTIIEKMKIARDEYGINKFAFWRLSAEDPELWKEL